MTNQCIWEQDWDAEVKCGRNGAVIRAGIMTGCDSRCTWTRDNRYGRLLSKYNRNGGRGVNCPFCGKPITWYDTRADG